MPLSSAPPTAPWTPTGPASDIAPAADVDRELLADFVAESREALATAEVRLLALESDPHDLDAVDTVFRVFHTVKGTSAFLALPLVSAFAHHAETLLARMRDGEVVCAGGYADLALRSVDMLKALVDGADGVLHHGGALAEPEGYRALVDALLDPEAAGVTAALSDDTTAIPRLGDILVGFGRADRTAIEAALRSPSGQPAGLAIVQSGAASLTDVAHALRRQKFLAAERAAGASTRVRVDHLDQLVDLVEALATVQAALAADPLVTDGASDELRSRVTDIGAIARDLQELTKATRLVRVGPTFQKVARVVRDVAERTGKEAVLVTDGEEVEIDRTLLGALSDALVHMARNAVDHGIEGPEARVAAGKPRAGEVRLRAYRDGAALVVELADDGRGVDRERLARRAVERGLIASAAGMADAEILDLMFAAGLSTAETVSDISGRGVGLDVVRCGVESAGGRVAVGSVPGAGSTFTVRLPLRRAAGPGA